jgi:hypothetical protein
VAQGLLVLTIIALLEHAGRKRALERNGNGAAVSSRKDDTTRT